MTATTHRLGSGRDAGLYYVNDPNREARPRNRDEYYLADGGGIWWSTGETVVRHGSAIDKETFRDLCAGVHPGKGKGLVRGSGKRHRAGWDVTFSAPKTLSLLWAAGTDTQRGEMEALHGKAVEAALRFIERQHLLEVRLGAGGIIREQPTDIIVGRFRHTTSRAGDPNLHTHCVFLNVAGSADGKHRTLEPDAMFKWVLTIGAAYRAELASLLAQKGFGFREAGQDQFEIDGIDPELIETFSKRSRMIEDVIGDRRTASAKRKERAALSTRTSKEELPTGAELEKRWYSEFGSDRDRIWEIALEAGRARTLDGARIGPGDAHSEFSHDDRADEEQGPALDPVPVPGKGPVACAASKLLSHESVVTRSDVLRHSLVAASLRGIDIEGVEAELQALQARKALITLREGRSAAWTTDYLIERETAMLRACRRGEERSFFRAEAVTAALAAAEHLSDEQQAAVQGAASRDGVSLIEAGAGTGKTTLAKAIKDAADRSGLRTIALAPTWLAADELTRSVGVPAQAAAKWRYDREIAAREGTAGRRAVTRFDSRTLVLVDEAGMLGTLDMAAVLVEAQRGGAKVIAFGDRRQLNAVSQGSALSAVAGELREVETLKIIRRQAHEWQRQASIAMSEGRFDKALAAYQDRDAILFADGAEAAVQQTLAAWQALRQRHGEDVVIVTRSNKDASTINRAVRQVLRQEGGLGETDVTVPAVNRKNKAVVLELAVGDRIRFGANLKAFGLRNGTRGTVRTIESRQSQDPLLTIEIEGGANVTAKWTDLAPPRRGRTKRPLPRITHAYAGTTYSVQGRTVDAAVFHVGMRTDARETYVAMTRHRSEAIMVVDADRLMRQTSKTIIETDGEATVDPKAKLAALVAEAERYDEKLNIVSFRPFAPERTQDRSPDLDLGL
ncbi:MobF family relaxase [Aurantimonas sp. VKM B-3413]|uniref:MobF family relaxase n=1 Tax=Aurantimonas sp. VKM B-3413 TaxID=2779401 RepID=UPI001E2A2270|nr:MobF family relaxase [Aurantimonas sp. VKM B-3413]MCB8839366.1 relaxase domain-containing protein [Aurantimonas sp. VKM B-3413]